MKYIFTPEAKRTAPTTFLTESGSVKLFPGNGELPDNEWKAIESFPAVQAMLESETLRIVAPAPAPAPAPSPSPKGK